MSPFLISVLVGSVKSRAQVEKKQEKRKVTID
jgi:hypothetical protein